ncbi:hypothetical protein CIG75_05185 [Tumebacillus algifaecis]|uniref:Insecticide toxin TcdB middle/N-terminal domain-containing protein n=1 Tax=Tumebacillus algifaecis TaxID=1214604 RepID=A0A223CYP0_9BACL|nr:FG-GAP-like repeat-containing protein [Tumebacillus algifaecis]ASS74441.1 hypothetical protein CIG75_05185 [Tumebacillus algifaecis]
MATSQFAGSLPGEFSVDANGSAVYSIPLQLPIGTAGVMPQFALVFHSAFQNGLLGMGWMLQGLSAISRVPATVAQDGHHGSVSYDQNDRYALDGQRLIVTDGSYGSSNSTYRTEMESWVKVVPVFHNPSQVAQGPDGFRVYTKDGKTCEYGLTADAKTPASATNPVIREWALNKVTDRHGNYMTFSYQQDKGNNAYYLSRIDYTGNSKLDPKRSVQFDYESRTDVEVAYAGGAAVKTTQRLRHITTKVNQSTVLQYQLDYQLGKATGRSQLRSLTLLDAAGNTMAPTKFEWQDETGPLLQTGKLLPSSGIPYGSTILPMDVNGDGRTDLVCASRDARGNLKLVLVLAKSDGSGYEAGIALPDSGLLFGGQFLPLDVNGDGCTDLVYAVNQSGKLALTVFISGLDHQGNWTLTPGPLHAGGPSGISYGGNLIACDVNGDGAVDLVYAYNYKNGNLGLITLLSNGTSFYRPDNKVTETTLSMSGQCIPLDLDGDGQTDLLYAYQNHGTLDFVWFRSNGTSYEQQPGSPLPASPSLPYGGTLLPMDVNGDGLIDLVYVRRNSLGHLSLQTLCSTGKGFEVQAEYDTNFKLGSVLPQLLPMDVTGDGKTDLVIASQDNQKVYLSYFLSQHGNFQAATNPQPLSSSAWGGQFLPLDLSGTGKNDLLYFTKGTTNYDLTHAASSPTMPDLLSKITTGLGGEYTLSYKPLTDNSVYSMGDQANSQIEPLTGYNTISGSVYQVATTGLAGGSVGSVPAFRDVTFPKYVVSEVVKADNQGNNYTSDYSYEDAKIDLQGRGWLGFAVMRVSDHEQKVTVETHYHQEFPLTGGAKEQKTYRSSDLALLERTLQSYQTPTSAPGVYRAEIQEIQTESYTYGVLDHTKQKTITYDAYGNPVVTIDSDEGIPSPLYTLNTYRNDPNQWVIGLLTETKLTRDAAGTQVLNWEKSVYEDGTYNLTKKQTWNDQSKTWLDHAFTYDAYGNQISMTDPSGALTTCTYDTQYQTFLTEQITPPNDAGNKLTTAYTYSPEFNVCVSKTEPNQTTMKQVLDGFGRVVQLLGPHPQHPEKQVVIQKHDWIVKNNTTVQETRQLLDWDVETWALKQEYVDGLGRIFKTISTSADGSKNVVQEKQLNSQGAAVRESLPYFEGNHPLYIERQYDEYGRMTQETNPTDGGKSVTTKLTYPNTRTEVKVEAVGTSMERTEQTDYAVIHDQKRIMQHTDATQGVTAYTYDPLGRVVSILDPNQVITTIEYDSLNREIKMEYKTLQKTFATDTYAHDDVKRTLTHQSSKGTQQVMAFDALQRMIRKTTTDGQQSRADIFTFDNAGQPTKQSHLSRVQDADGNVYEFDYDAYGNQTKISLTLDKQNYTFEKTYSPTQAPIQLTFPDGSYQVNKYTAGGQLQAVRLNDQGAGEKEYASYQQFTVYGAPQLIQYGNGTSDRYDYNTVGQIGTRLLKTSKGTEAFHHNYAWNELNTLSSIQDQLTPSKSQSFQYDAAGRLTQAVGVYGTQTYSYDPAGNTSNKNGIQYDFEGHQVVKGHKDGQTVMTASYDDRGNMSDATRNGQTSQFDYDGEGQLLSVGGVHFTYDYAGRRLSKRSPDGVVTYYVSPYYEVVVFPDGNVQHTKYLADVYGTFATVTTSQNPAHTQAGLPAPGTFYLHKNMINSTLAQTDSSGAVVTTLEYLPFGEIYDIQGSRSLRYSYTGKEFDQDTGLYYYESRYYDPQLGRFLSADDRPGGPLDKQDVFNRYAYVLNDPVNFMDPTGHSIWSDIGHFFKKCWENVVGIVVGAALVVAGIAVLATTPFGSVASTIVGQTLIGAGLGGISYSVSSMIKGQQFSWKEFGIQVGIGAATGLVAGIFSAGSSAIIDYGVQAGRSTFGIGGVGRFAVKTTSSALSSASKGALSKVLNNAAHHEALGHGVGGAALFGGITGFIGASMGEGVTYWRSAKSYVYDIEAAEKGVGLPYRRVMKGSILNKILVKAPGFIFKKTSKALLSHYHLMPSW